MVDTIEYLNDSSKINRMSIPIFPTQSTIKMPCLNQDV